MQANPHPFAEDEIAEAFPGCVMTHVLTLAGEDQLAIAIEALQAVQKLGGRLEGLHVARSGGLLGQRLKIVGLRAEAAQKLCDRLAALPGVARASLEHQILRQPAPV